MFKNEYQGGPYFEVFSAQWKDSPNQWKQPPSGIKKIFDKEVKSFVVAMEGSGITTRMDLPKDSKQCLGLLQRYLVLQLCIPKGQELSIELGVSDLNPHRRRLVLSTTCHKESHSDPLRGKFPLGFIRRSVWLNLCMDLGSLVADTMRGQTFKSVESIGISGSCRLRRIFTMRAQPADTTNDEDLYGFTGINSTDVEDIPKQCQLAPDLHCTQVVNVMKIQYYEGKGKISDGLYSHTGSNVDLDLNSSGGKKSLQESSHIAFGTKVPGTAPPRKGSGKEGSSSSRQPKSFHSRTKPDCSHRDGSPMTSRGAAASQTGPPSERRGSGRERKNSDPGANMEDPEISVDKESLRTSHTWTDGAENKEDIPFVKPHPPPQPSSGSRRKPRVKSAGKERTPHTISYRDDSRNNSASKVHHNGEDSSMAAHNAQPKMMASEEDEARILSEMQRESNAQNHRRSESESDVSSQNTSGVIEAEDSITDLINTLKMADQPKDSDGDDEEEEEDEVYTFSSPPKTAPRLRQMAATRAKKSYSKGHRTRVKRKSSDVPQSGGDIAMKPRAARLESDFDRGENPSSEEEESIRSRVLRKASPNEHQSPRKTSHSQHQVSSNSNKTSPAVSGARGAVSHLAPSPASLLQPSLDDFKSPANSQSRMSISKKSLREIPREELRRSGGQKTYNSNKYQMADLSDSFEAQMLQNLKREAMEDGVNSDDEPGPRGGVAGKSPPKGLNRSKLHYDDLSGSSSDDTSLSTLKSPGSVKHRPHNYQDEMRILSNSFLTQSNPRDWGNVFSPPIVTQGSQQNGVSEVLAPIHDHSPSNEVSRLVAALGAEPLREETATAEQSDAEDELDLLYDPVLNCYYDVKTGKYYELV